jgi:hypothetical protein
VSIYSNSTEHENGAGMLVRAAAGALVGGTLWGLLILAVRWLLQLPQPIRLRLAAGVLLCAGTGLIFASLVRLELKVRPSPDPTRGRPAGAVPPSARAASTSAPLPAGGRAFDQVRPS